MIAYTQSGRAAAARLTARAGHRRVLHCMQRLRGFKQVINLLCFTALVTIPIAGVMADSAALAAVVGLSFLLVIWLLEIAERGAKRELAELRESAGD